MITRFLPRFVLLNVLFLLSNISFSQLSGADSELLKKEILERVNEYRAENGLAPLLTDEILEKAAESQCKYMVKYDTLTHAQKRGTLKTPKKRVKYFKGKMFESVDENILYEEVNSFRMSKKEVAQLASTLLLQWKNSSVDNANLLNTEFTFCGISVDSDTKKSHVFAALVFAQKGIEIEGQLSSNGFGLRSASENCMDQYNKYINLVLNIGNSIRIEGDEIVFYHHNISLFKQIFNSTKDGIAIDLVRKSQFPCNGPNQLDRSGVYNGILLKPVYRDEILANNRAENPRHIVSTIGKLPKEFNELDLNEIGLSSILIDNGKACLYMVHCYVPSQEYELLDVSPILIDPKNTVLEGPGVSSMEQLTFEFDASQTTPKNTPKLERRRGKVVGATIQSYSSVEGDSLNNEILHDKRANAIKNYLTSRLNIRSNQIQIDSKVNWERMRFQLLYAGADSIAVLPNDSIRGLIASGDSTMNWDSLLYVQRTAIATIYFEDKSSRKLTPSEQLGGQLAAAIAKQLYTPANKCLKLLYDLDEEIDARFLFSGGLFDAIKTRPELVQNSAALLSKYYYFDLHKTTEFIFAWMSRKDELSNDAKHNLMILYTKLGMEFLDRWDVSSERLSNVVHPIRVEEIAPENIQSELLLNAQLVYISYFGQINDRMRIQESFNFIADYFKENAISEEDDLKLALFFNNWSSYQMTVDFLLTRYKSNTLNEDALFVLGQTLYFWDSEHALFEDIHQTMIDQNNVRWCEWVDQVDFQVLRNTGIKSMYCENCP
ncbi:MAG: hypothetical protein HWE22_07570 [Flavobacteriales bacterium]|nr:hypothetical protein [Flavobacteriales bacterium]